ncbi:MAG: DUF4105 domain-containing protein [Xanthomonadales bacterium]|nr:DUF4105 domain-containing protein [Xanthomonadales bacterium]
MRRLLLGLLGGLLACSATAQQLDRDSGEAFRIALVTAAPGEIYWQRFGHNALLVENTVTGDARLYNFGIFDFEQENFLLNFVQGRMLYRLAAFAPQSDLANYAAEGRSVWIQELALRPDQRYAVAEMLAENALPEHAEYRYDYFAVNCSTRLRDVLDAVLEGDLHRSMSVRARGESYRSLATTYAAPEPWLALGIDLGLGPAADRRLSFWDEMFLPLRLRDLLREMRVRDVDGHLQPLVAREWTAYSGRLDDRLPERGRWFLAFALAGLGGALLLHLGLQSRRASLGTIAAIAAAGSASILGLGGLLLAFLWVATDHAIAYANLNLVLFDPLCLLLAWPLWRSRQRPAGSHATRALSALVLLVALAGLGYTSLPGTQQANAHWFALILPLHLVFAWRFWFTPAH